MAPTTDVLYDLMGRALAGMPLLREAIERWTRVMVGAVAYDPKVVPIWEGIREYFRGAPVGMDFVLFSELRGAGERAAGREDRHRVEHEPRVRADVPRDARRVPGPRDA